MIQQTPILIDLNSFITQPKRDIVLPSKAELNVLTTPILLSPKLTIKIYPPQHLANWVGQTPLVYHVPSHGFLKDKVRLSLPPCEGYGINACYRVEYWSWQPVISGVRINPLPKVASRLVRTDHWLVPSFNLYTRKYHRSGIPNSWGGLAPGEFRHLHYDIPVRYYEPFWNYSSNAQLLVLRLDTNLENSYLFTNSEVIQLVEDNPTLQSVIYSQAEASSLFPETYYTNEVVIKELQLQWLPSTTPPISEVASVDYVHPVRIEDIYFVNYLEEREQNKPIRYHLDY